MSREVRQTGENCKRVEKKEKVDRNENEKMFTE